MNDTALELNGLERSLSGGQEPWTLEVRTLSFGPFKGEAMAESIPDDEEEEESADGEQNKSET